MDRHSQYPGLLDPKVILIQPRLEALKSGIWNLDGIWDIWRLGQWGAAEVGPGFTWSLSADCQATIVPAPPSVSVSVSDCT